jgi:hypothetical protein
MSLTRDLGTGTYGKCDEAPPPLHVYDLDTAAARWHPLPRPELRPPAPGSQLVTVQQSRADLIGDDPTDPNGQTVPRVATAGMIGYLNIRAGSNVGGSGARS